MLELNRRIALLTISAFLIIAIASVTMAFLFHFQSISHGQGKGFGSGGNFAQSTLPEVIAVVAFAVAIGVIAYNAILPQMPMSPVSLDSDATMKNTDKHSSFVSEKYSDFLDVEEKKVCEVLSAAGGTLLQKEISWKTGYSKVKTHRVVYRLAKRGLIEVEQYFNTNKVKLKSLD